MKKKTLKKKETPKKILVVDDEPAIRNMLKKFLTKKGYKAIIASSGEEAIKKVKKEKPHVVLLDIKMPGIDGVETLKKIKTLDKKTGIVMITVVDDEEIARKCMGLGAVDYIAKPLGLDYLENVLMVKLMNRQLV